ncbi:MAG: hypothetical protein LBN18_06675 [Dysgonamonadaceae bacterium]|jgi:uncharacterized protein (TIGR02145 family)|nr:hypothetical protein [Dysgonamonadaceae bacterium]
MEKQNTFNKIFWYFVALYASAVAFNSCYSKKQILTTDDGVIINGVKWATRNVNTPGTFAENSENSGMFYQWNKKVGWSSTDPMINSNGNTVWSDTEADDSIWEKKNDPCPAGWRVPTYEEMQSLLDFNKINYLWTTKNGVCGRVFYDMESEASLFLPAVGYRRERGEMGGNTIWEGYYWSSSTENGSNARFLFFHSFNLKTYLSYSRAYGCCVRCVAK